MISQRGGSINTQVVLSFGIILLVITLAMGLSGYMFSKQGMNNMKRLHEETLLSKLDCDAGNVYKAFTNFFGQLGVDGEKFFDEEGREINGNTEFVDSVLENYGNLTTIFVKSGNDFKRISTNIMEANGQRAIGTMLGKDSAAYETIINGKTYTGQAMILGKSYLTLYKPLIINKEVKGILFIGLEDEDIKNQMNVFFDHLWTVNMIITVIAMIFGLSIVYFISQRITTPIKKLSETLKKVTDYDLTDDRDDYLDKILSNRTEIGDMARDIQSMKNNLKLLANEMKEQSDFLETSAEKMMEISNSQQSGSLHLAEIVRDTENETATTNSSIQEVSVGIENITESAQEISNATAEISVQTEQTSELTNSRLKIMKEVIGTIEKTSDQMEKTAEITSDLSNKTENVGEIVNTISSIAEQTNLLALNAAIEAARAGEAGKGFAVVADEIRKLAEESKRATIDISNILEQITASVKDVNSATDITAELVKSVTFKSESISTQFGKIAENIGKVSENIVRLSSSSEEQTASTEEISAAMDSSAKAVEIISEKLNTISQNAVNQSKQSDHLSEAARKVMDITEHLRGEINKFKL
ncbi:MAG TPA: methyl-accepting chemotaxis protein [Thermotogota bacterium]|nr:methyl-accepting chemotaxis protein [Thermotogota bacterium]